MPVPDHPSLYKALYRIRRFEETVLDEFPRGRFYGTTHTYIGQEANAVGVLGHLERDDIVVSNHRCHGHFLAYGGDLRALFAELMGKATGVCGGRGGSQHLNWKNFYSNGVLGGTLPIATGIALGEKLQGNSAITIVFLGDGAMGEGVVYESLNMASLWAVPLLFVVENNHIAQTTPIERHLAGDIVARFAAFGIPIRQLDTSDVLVIQQEAGETVANLHNGQTPQAIVIETCRFAPHSKGDDTRSQEEIEQLRLERDPLKIHGLRLDLETRTRIQLAVDLEVSQAFQQALDDPYPSLEGVEGVP